MPVAVAVREGRGALERAAEPPISVEMVEGREAFNALEKEWNAALPRGPRDEPMLRAEYYPDQVSPALRDSLQASPDGKLAFGKELSHPFLTPWLIFAKAIIGGCKVYVYVRIIV